MGFRGLVLGNREGPVMLARDDQSSPQSQLKRTPLHALHVARGGKMVPFAGYDMPVQYAAGVLREHLHTRTNAGLFDVSHMGQIALHAKSGKVEDAALALERLVPQDILGVAAGRPHSAQFPHAVWGILVRLGVGGAAGGRGPRVAFPAMEAHPRGRGAGARGSRPPGRAAATAARALAASPARLKFLLSLRTARRAAASA